MAFHGLRVLALESRRANEIGILIRNQGGDAFVAPSMREAPLAANDHVFAFAERMFAGEFDACIFLTGVGTRALYQLLLTRYSAEQIHAAWASLARFARGPKPTAVLRELGLPPHVIAPEPNTWRELLTALQGRTETRIAVQEYGRSNPELIAALEARGATVTPVRIYQWELPEDTGPLREAARRLAHGLVDIALFTTANQVAHLLQIAREENIESEVLDALRKRVVVASIGPTCSETLDDYSIPTDIAPSHPKMGFLVKETADQAQQLLERKR